MILVVLLAIILINNYKQAQQLNNNLRVIEKNNNLTMLKWSLDQSIPR